MYHEDTISFYFKKYFVFYYFLKKINELKHFLTRRTAASTGNYVEEVAGNEINFFHFQLFFLSSLPFHPSRPFIHSSLCCPPATNKCKIHGQNHCPNQFYYHNHNCKSITINSIIFQVG